MNTVQSSASAPRRPLIVTIIAVLFLLAVPAFALSVYDAVQVLNGNVPGVAPSSAYVQLAAAAVLIPVCAAIGVGLWRLRDWARQLAVVALIVVIVNILLTSLRGLPWATAMLNTLSGSLIPLAIILLLYHPMTRAAFDAARSKRS